MEYNGPSGINKQKAYFCNAKGVFPIPKGNMSPAAPSLVVLGENASAISVTLRVGSLSRMVTAEERPITPAPTTAMEAILLGNHAKMVTLTSRAGHATTPGPPPAPSLLNARIESRENWAPGQNGRLDWVGSGERAK